MSKQGFFEAYREAFGPLKEDQVVGLEFLLDKLVELPPSSLEHAAYMLATVKHETADTYQPVKEGYWIKNAEQWRKNNLRYYPWYGRGYVQLTWEYNYRKASQLLHMDLTTDPDAVMEPTTSYMILLRGMQEGWFTGKKLNDYINKTEKNYVAARRIINGVDRAVTIASYAKKFESCLKNIISEQKDTETPPAPSRPTSISLQGKKAPK